MRSEGGARGRAAVARFQRGMQRKGKCCRESEEHPGGVLDPDVRVSSQVLTGCSGLVPCTFCSTQPRARPESNTFITMLSQESAPSAWKKESWEPIARGEM